MHQILVNRGLLFLDTKDYTRALEDIIAAGQVRRGWAGSYVYSSSLYMHTLCELHTYVHTYKLTWVICTYIRCMHSWYMYVCIHVHLNPCVECVWYCGAESPTVNYTLHRWDSYYCSYILYIRMYVQYIYTYFCSTCTMNGSNTFVYCNGLHIYIHTCIYIHMCTMNGSNACVCTCTWVRSTSQGSYIQAVLLQCTPVLFVMCTYAAVSSRCHSLPSNWSLLPQVGEEVRTNTHACTHTFPIVHSNMVYKMEQVP